MFICGRYWVVRAADASFQYILGKLLIHLLKRPSSLTIKLNPPALVIPFSTYFETMTLKIWQVHAKEGILEDSFFHIYLPYFQTFLEFKWTFILIATLHWSLLLKVQLI